MSTKGRNQFSHNHPNTGQRLAAARDRAKAKGEIHNQKSGLHMSEAPHFPPSENLPPQAKRVAMKKRREAHGGHEGEDAARAHGAGLQAMAGHDEHRREGQVRAEDYPDALPREVERREGMIDRAEPVFRDAQGHWAGLVEAGGRFISESVNLLRTPGVLLRALLRTRHA